MKNVHKIPADERDIFLFFLCSYFFFRGFFRGPRQISTNILNIV